MGTPVVRGLSTVAIPVLAALACAQAPEPSVPQAAAPGEVDGGAVSAAIVSVRVLPAPVPEEPSPAGSAAPADTTPPPPPLEEPGSGVRPPVPDTGGPMGSLNRGPVLDFMREHQEEIQGCYDRALADDPELAGDISYIVTLRPDGGIRVEVEQASGPLTAAGVTECVQRVLLGMRRLYPDQPSEFRLRLPLSFVPPGADAEEGTVTPAPPDPLREPLSQEAALRVVQAGREALRQCYETARARTSAVPPGLTVEGTATVSAEGRVDDVSASSDEPLDPELERCLLDSIRTWQFPPGAGTSRVVVMVYFRAP